MSALERVAYSDGSVPLVGQLVKPAATPRAAIAVFPTFMNSTPGVEAKALALAEQGYCAFIADFYGPDCPHDFASANEAMMRLRADPHIMRNRLQATIDKLRELEPGVPLVAIGFCLGGMSVLELARWGQFQVLGHLTLPLRYINEHHGEHMTFRRHMDRVEEVLRTVIPKGVGIECNTNRGNEPLPGEEILRLYRSLGGEIITLGSDAHRPEDVGCFIRQRQELLRTCGFRYFTTFERGRPLFQAL